VKAVVAAATAVVAVAAIATNQRRIQRTNQKGLRVLFSCRRRT
jgi:hypothetical protein